MRATNRAVEKVGLLKRDKLGNPLDAPPPPAMPLAQKCPVLSDITHNESFVVETCVAACRKKKQILLLALQKANNVFWHAFLAVILCTFFNMRLRFAALMLNTQNVSDGPRGV
jgi:hypothetical protein